MEEKLKPTFGDCIFIFIGIVVGAGLVYRFFPHVWWPLGAAAGGSVVAFWLKGPVILSALWKHVLTNLHFLGSASLWTLAIGTPLFSIVWVFSTIARMAEAEQFHKGSSDFGAAVFGSLNGFLTSPTCTFWILGTALFCGCALGAMWASNERELTELRPRIAVNWILFGNPLAVGIYTTVIGFSLCAIVVAAHFLLDFVRTWHFYLGVAVVALAVVVVLFLLWRGLVRLHCEKVLAYVAHVFLWSVIGGVGAHIFPQLLVTIPGYPLLPETFVFLGAALCGVITATLGLWVLKGPVTKTLKRDAELKAQVAAEIAKRQAAGMRG